MKGCGYMAFEIFTHKDYASVKKYIGSEKTVIIPSLYNGVPVREICAKAFADNSEIEFVYLPNELQAIGSNAFFNCRKLKSFDIGFEDIAASCESDAALPSKRSVFPDSLVVVEAGAFKKTSLRNVEFRSDMISLGNSAFEKCARLGRVSFPNCKIMSLGKYAFTGSAITHFYAPGVHMPIIPEGVFANCKKLTVLELSADAIGPAAFYNCEHLKTLKMPKELSTIAQDAFTGCTSLEPNIRPVQRIPSSTAKPIEPIIDPDELTLKEITDFIEELDEQLDAIKATEMEATQVEPHKKHIVADPYDLGPPLFTVSIHYQGHSALPIPTEIRGSWKQEEGSYTFCVNYPPTVGDVKMTFLNEQDEVYLRPLLDYLSKEILNISLLGRQDGNHYAVYDLFSTIKLPESGLSREFFHKIIDCLKRATSKISPEEISTPPFMMRTEAEYETFLKICGDNLPAWVLQAYNKNKEIIRHRMGRSSDDECKHARRALELLMNIEWLPCVMNIPTAEEVRRILDEEFYGLASVKERIMEVVAQIRRTNKLPKWGILLHGPAGTGKTTIVNAVARIFNMPMLLMDMSSVGDNAETISGSNRIYSNARPGMILESMLRVRSSTAIFLANEIDKAGAGKNGRCAADILLSILDKTGFYENFLEEVVPTDNLFCIGTCNDLSKISKPIQDRFLIINIAGYTPSEKKVIFQDYVFPSAKTNSGISESQLSLDNEAVDLLISEYALEPGARDLEQYAERFVGNYCRHLDENAKAEAARVYTAEDVKAILGPSCTISRHFAIYPGQINTAFYHDGKAHFFLMEAAIASGTGKFKVLGPVDKLQTDYCEAAFWCARNTISSTVCDFSKCDTTIFVPQPIPESVKNYVGFACYAAICSRLMNTNLAIDDTCFIGGCDMNGSMYFDENDLTPLLQSMKARGISTLFAPMGTNRLINTKVTGDCGVTIIEAPDAKTLLSLAVAQKKNAH